MTIIKKPGDGPPSDFLGRHGDLTSNYQASYNRHAAAANGQYGTGLGNGDPNNLVSYPGDGGPTDRDADSPVQGDFGKGVAGGDGLVTRGGADSGEGFGKALM